MLNQLSTRQWPLPGYAGDFPFFGPMVVKPVILKTSNAALNVPGVALTFQNGSTTNAVAGGTGVFAGILSNKNTQPYDGNLPTGPVLNIPNDTPTFATSLTTGVYATLSTTARVGDGVAFSTSTGVLAAAPGGVAPNGHTVIPGAVIFRRNVDAAGTVGIVQFTIANAPISVVSDALPDLPSGTTISAFTTASNALPTGMTDNTADPFPGTTSSVTAMFSSGANPPKDIRPLVAGAPVDLRGGLVSFSIKLRPSGTLSNGIANVGGFFVNLYNDSNPAAAKTNYMRGYFGGTANNEPFTGQWQTFRLPIEAFGVASGGSIADTQAYLSSIRYIGLQFVHSLANADSFQVSVSDVKVIPRAVSKGLVVLGFDDCRRDTFAYAYPKMKAFGFPGVLYPGAIKACLDQNDSFFMNTANVLAMQADGWQTAYQAYNMENPSMSAADFETQEIQPLLAMYPAKGFNGPKDGSYFSNVNFNSVYQPVFDQYFRTMRGFRQFSDVQTPRTESLPVADPRNVRAYGVDTANNSATNGLIPYAQRAATQKGVAIFVWHALSAGDAKIAADGGTLTGFEKLLEWLNSAEGRAAVDVVTWDEAVRRWRAGTA